MQSTCTDMQTLSSEPGGAIMKIRSTREYDVDCLFDAIRLVAHEGPVKNSALAMMLSDALGERGFEKSGDHTVFSKSIQPGSRLHCYCELIDALVRIEHEHGSRHILDYFAALGEHLNNESTGEES